MLLADVAYEHRQTVHLGRGTYHWVSVKRFRIERDGADRELLAALIAHWAYHDHYAGAEAIDQDHHALHGPYRLECITPATFQPALAGTAQALLQGWAEQAIHAAPSRQVQAELDAKVYRLLDAGPVYRLPDLRPEAEHDWGWVVGAEAFHEYVAIDRAAHAMSLIVAADD